MKRQEKERSGVERKEGGRECCNSFLWNSNTSCCFTVGIHFYFNFAFGLFMKFPQVSSEGSIEIPLSFLANLLYQP